MERFLVVNLSMGEVRAELASVKDAISLADRLAELEVEVEVFAVIASHTIYETRSVPRLVA